MKNIIIMITTLLIISNSTFSQEKSESKEKKRYENSLGFGAGISTGYGMSYRYFGEKYGAQINFSPYKDENTINISLGLTFLYRLGDIKDYSFYIYQGNHFFYDDRIQTEYNFETNVEFKVNKTREFFNHAIGVGVEYVSTDRISLNGMVGYGAQQNFKIISISAEVAVYFKF